MCESSFFSDPYFDLVECGCGVQVEQVRLGIPTEQPLAVQQWDGLIAVNYAARAAGIVRHERVSEALRKVGSPSLHFLFPDMTLLKFHL